MARQEGGPAMMEEIDMDVEPIAKKGDSLPELYAEALLAKNPDFFNKFYKKETKLNQVAAAMQPKINPQMGLSSMPVANASFGGFLKDLGINIGKAVVGDVVGAGIGSIADSFTDSKGNSPVGDFFDSSLGRGFTGAATNAALDYGFSEYFDEGQGPNIGSFGFDFAAGALGDYATRPKEERDFYGFDVDKEEEELKRRFNQNAITFAEKAEGDRQIKGVRERRRARINDDPDFLS